jgi:hypothetical protein
MTVCLNRRLTLRELMEQAWHEVEGQARTMVKRSVEGVVAGRTGPARDRGQAARRESVPVGIHGAEVWDDPVGKSGAGVPRLRGREEIGLVRR